MDPKLIDLAEQINHIFIDEDLSIATAESCTGGLLGHILTCVSGASKYFVGGVIAYSNHIKTMALGVQEQTLIFHGAVSAQCAREMADGIRTKFATDIGISTTGIAGPTGGTPEKPVGLVWIGISTIDETTTFKCQFTGTRDEVKKGTVTEALTYLIKRYQK
ncbi:MAG: CinA family protein [Anaerolineales bacterium]